MAPAGARHRPGDGCRGGAGWRSPLRSRNGILRSFVRSSPKRRDQGQGLAAGAQDVAARRAGRDLSPMGGARGAAGMRRPSAADPARPHLPDRRAGPPASWPEPEADRPVAGRELRAAVPRRPVGSDPQGAEAGARIDHAMVRGYAAWPCAHARPVCSGVALPASGPADPGGPDPHRSGGGCHGPPVQRRCREPWPRHHVQSRQVRARQRERARAARSRADPRRPRPTDRSAGAARAARRWLGRRWPRSRTKGGCCSTRPAGPRRRRAARRCRGCLRPAW